MVPLKTIVSEHDEKGLVCHLCLRIVFTIPSSGESFKQRFSASQSLRNLLYQRVVRAKFGSLCLIQKSPLVHYPVSCAHGFHFIQLLFIALPVGSSAVVDPDDSSFKLENMIVALIESDNYDDQQ